MKQIIKFTADWCQPCKQVAPILDQLKKEAKDVDFKTIDVEKDPQQAMYYHVSNLPTVLFISGDQEVTRIVGNKMISEYREALQKL